MATLSIICEQAIFTSARGPAGEGYRIVAASKGLRADEKQKITRCSPSHESLCGEARSSRPAGAGIPTIRTTQISDPRRAIRAIRLSESLNSARQESTVEPAALPRKENEGATGAAFYALPGGRICIALSRPAGAEHSGRGGQCVHTHNVVVSEEDFARCGFNPFAIIRALLRLPADTAKPAMGGILPELELEVDCGRVDRLTSDRAALLPSAARTAALQVLLEEKAVVVDLPKEWLCWAEAFMVAIPGPMRTRISFAAGLRFSMGRGHKLHVLLDEKNAVQGKAAAQGIHFFGAKESSAAEMQQSQARWLAFVERHWSAGDLAGLSRRTSRPFEDCCNPARERIGELFNSIDAIAQTDVAGILDMAFRSFDAPHPGVEGQVHREFRDAAISTLRSRLSAAPWSQVQPSWSKLSEFWKRGGDRAAFAMPLLDVALAAALKSDPLMAAELALGVPKISPGADASAYEAMMQRVLNSLASLDPGGSDTANRLAKLMPRWRALRPACPLVTQICDRLTPAHGVR